MREIDKTRSGPGPVVLLTDFGHVDPFAGLLKGVIAAINPDARIIDLSHGIEPQNIFQAAFLLRRSYSYFPVNSIFCVVVDPGVGSGRKALCIQTSHYTFVGPDNGVLWAAADSDQIRKIIHLTNPDYFLKQVSGTFHGRDLFAPVSAHLSLGIPDAALLGPAVHQCIRLDMPQITTRGEDYELTILHIDRFGNIALNLTKEQFETIVEDRPFSLTLNNREVIHRCNTYSEAEPDRLFLIHASSGVMEVSLQNKNAAEHLSVNIMDKGMLRVISDTKF